MVDLTLGVIHKDLNFELPAYFKHGYLTLKLNMNVFCICTIFCKRNR